MRELGGGEPNFCRNVPKALPGAGGEREEVAADITGRSSSLFISFIDSFIENILQLPLEQRS